LILIGSMTPPLGLTIYVMKGVLGELVPIGEMFRGCIIFVLMEIVTIGIIIAFPSLATWLPSLM
ncbi:unnamed protein product, partial [marine sediment metagenome]